MPADPRTLRSILPIVAVRGWIVVRSARGFGLRGYECRGGDRACGWQRHVADDQASRERASEEQRGYGGRDFDPGLVGHAFRRGDRWFSAALCVNADDDAGARAEDDRACALNYALRCRLLVLRRAGPEARPPRCGGSSPVADVA